MRATLVMVAAASAALLCSCAPHPDSAARPGTSMPVTSSAAARSSGCAGQGFGLSVVPGTVGSASPLLAARDFVRQGGVPGYGSPDSKWQVGAAGSDGKVTVSDGHTELYAVQLPDKSWVIASGDKCG